LTDKAFALWSAPLEHFPLDGQSLDTADNSGALRGHCVTRCIATVLWPARLWMRFRMYLSTADDPGAPFECLELDLAPGHISEWNYQT